MFHGLVLLANLPEPKGARRGLAITREVMPQCRWLKPEVVAQVEFVDWTEKGHLCTVAASKYQHLTMPPSTNPLPSTICSISHLQHGSAKLWRIVAFRGPDGGSCVVMTNGA